jgi:hypothetical protein
MNMNRLTLLIAAGMIYSLGIYAQSGTVVGEIVDQSSNMVIPFAAIQFSKDGKIVRTVQADIDGKYKFEKIPCGTYSMKVNCVGYDSLHISDVTINENRKLTMNLEVSPKSNQITEVIPIPLYVPKRDTIKNSPGDSLNPKARPKRGQR